MLLWWGIIILGFILTIFSFVQYAKSIHIWLLLFTSLFWVVNRLLHGVKSSAGETERDGVIWLFPLALGWIMILGEELMNNRHLIVMILWVLVVNIIVTVNRPEFVPDTKLAYCEPPGLMAILKSLLKYQLNVCAEDSSSSEWTQGRFRSYRYSISYLMYSCGYAGVAGVVFISQDFLVRLDAVKAANIAGWVVGSTIPLFVAIVAATCAGISLAFSASEARIGWKIQPAERQILTFVYFLSTLFLIIFIVIFIVLPWLHKM